MSLYNIQKEKNNDYPSIKKRSPVSVPPTFKDNRPLTNTLYANQSAIQESLRGKGLLIQRRVIDAKHDKVDNLKLRQLLGDLATRWTFHEGDPNRSEEQRELFDPVIDNLVDQYGEKNKKLVKLNWLFTELAVKMPHNLMKPSYTVHQSSRQGDVDEQIATDEDGRLNYGPATGERIDDLHYQPIRKNMLEEKSRSELMWTLDQSQNVNVKKRLNHERTPHPTLVGGVEPSVISGGTVTTNKQGQIEEIRDDSGHFRPRSRGVPFAIKWIREHHLPLSSDFRGFRSFGMGEHEAGIGATFQAQWKMHQSKIDGSLSVGIDQLQRRISANDSFVFRQISVLPLEHERKK